MSDAKSWVEERRTILTNDAKLIREDRAQDAFQEFPRALDALNAVLEVCDKALVVKVEGSCEGEVAMAAMAATVKRAIEGAINE